MKTRKLLAIFLLTVAALSASAEGYIGVGGVLSLPQGGSSMRRSGGAAVRGGVYLSDNWAVEGEIAWQEKLAGLGMQALGHWSAWEWYDQMFGFSAFDPFVTLGARGWLGDEAGQVGPKAGLGAFYHFDDHWSLRLDADATLGLDTKVEMVYTLGVGLQYAF